MTQSGKIITAAAFVALVVVIGVSLIDVDVDGEFEVPTAELTGGNIELPTIETSGGNVPAVDVNTADVTIGESTRNVDVPTDIDVKTEERSITYPTIDVDLPEENTTAEENDLN